MRYIHPVGQQEQFVASGEYLLGAQEQRGEVCEQWSIHEQPDGAHKLRTDSLHPDGAHYTLAEAWISPPAEGGRLERLDFLRQSKHSSASNRITYLLQESHLEIGCTLADGERLFEERPLPEGSVLFADAFALRGLAIYTLIQRQQDTRMTTFIVLRDTFVQDRAAAPDDLLQPRSYPVTLHVHGQDSFATGSQTHRVQRCSLDAPVPAQVAVDAHGILMEYRTDAAEADVLGQGPLRAVLVNYAHRP